MYCENCGARIDDDSKFCENCGVLIKSDDDSIEPVTDPKQLTEIDSEAGEPAMTDTQVFTKEEFFKSEDLPEVPEESREPEEPVSGEADDGEQEPEAAAVTPQEDIAKEPEIEPRKESPALEVPAFLAGDIIKDAEQILEPATEEFLEAEEQTEPDQGPEPELQEEQPKTQESVVDCTPAAAVPQTWTGELPAETAAEPAEAKGEDEAAPLFCMACGRRLPKGAAFCDACGTPTGEVAPDPIHRKRPGQGIFVGLAKDFFIKPAATIKKAAAEEAFLPGIGFLLIKDVILAVLAAVFMEKLSENLGFFGTWFTGGDAFGFGAKAFLISIVLDALWIGLFYGAGILFKGKGSVKELTGAWGTAALLSSALLIVTTVLTAFVPAAAVCAVLITLAAALITMVKALSAAMDLAEDGLIYAALAAFACYMILVFLAVRILA